MGVRQGNSLWRWVPDERTFAPRLRHCDRGRYHAPRTQERRRSWVAGLVTENRGGDLAVLDPKNRSGAGRMESLRGLSFALTSFPVKGVLTDCFLSLCRRLKIESDRWEGGGVSSVNGGFAYASRRRLSVGAASQEWVAAAKASKHGTIARQVVR